MLPAQCRAARAFLDWSQQHLATAAGVGVVTVRQFEAGAGAPRNATLEALMNTLEAAGIEFLAGHGGGPGVRLKQDDVSRDGFLAFLKLYERNRLRALGRQVGALQELGYAFTYVGREGADLTFRGERLGQVRWRDGAPAFAPPLFPETVPELSDKTFDAWVSRAEYRRTTGI
ncbi:MAG: helix-turn-helix domain-containing protein [Devosia sp.]|nr:helix-turn-helix domain-containing protein [Devosia sp.]